MKRHVQLEGVRKWAGDHLLELEGQPLEVLDRFFGQYGSYVLAGCAVTPAADEVAAADGLVDVAPGLVVLTGEDASGADAVMVVPFEGAAGVPLPIYLTLAWNTRLGEYVTGGEKPIAYDYYASASTVEPAEGTMFLSLNADTPRFVDVIQDATHSFITEAEREKWNGKATETWVKEWIEQVLSNFDPTKVGDHRLIRNEMQFSDSRYLPMNGSRILVSDYPDMPFAFPISTISDSVNPKTSAGTNPQIQGVFYRDGEYVAIEYSGDVMRSADGKNWTVENLIPTTGITSAAYGDGICVVCGSFGIFRSTDLISWEKTSGTAMTDVAFGGGVFVCTGNNGLYTSTDGLTWEKRGIPGPYAGEACYNNGLWVVLSGATVITSTDLVNWTQRFKTSSNASLSKLSFCGGKWITSYGTTAVLSTDGITWTQKSISAVGTLYRVIYVGDQYLLIAGGSIFATTDFTTFTKTSLNHPLADDVSVFYPDNGGVMAADTFIVFYDQWYTLPNYSNPDYTMFLKVYEK